MPDSETLVDGATVIAGLGETGLSVAAHLAAAGARFVVMDSRSEPPGRAAFEARFPGRPVLLGALDAAQLQRAARVVLSPGLARSEPAIAAAIAAGVEVIGDVELFARAATAPVAAITGSNGKSTVTCMLRDMAEAAGRRVLAGGNLGPPALTLLDGAEPDLYVLELSSFQLESTCTLAPRVAAVLNLSEDHLDRYAGMAEYRAAKARIFQAAGAAVVPPELSTLAAASGVPVVRTFDLHGAHADYRTQVADGRRWLLCGTERALAADELPLAGTHNLVNALAALALGDLLGLPHAAMRTALVHFKGLPHRCELVGVCGGVRYVNDSKGTNVGATVAAVEGLAEEGPLVLIAGGEGKGADFTPLRAALRNRVRLCVLIGRDAGALAAAIGATCEVRHAADLEAAVALAAATAQAGWTVLLSPACASFDMYASYMARGEHFRRLVGALAS